MYKYNKNDNITKELVWFSGQCFPWSLERLGLVSSPMGMGSSPSQCRMSQGLINKIKIEINNN